jgi:hypothetical protein
MSISVTPIPKLIEFAAPAFTLGTANSAGAASTAVASDSTLLVFDTTTPAATAATGSVGSATTAPRRDHVHAGYNISCGVYHNATISVANATQTALSFNSEVWDTDSMHDTSTNNSRVTFKTAGIYAVNANVQWANNTTGKREAFIKINGTSTILGNTEIGDATGGSLPQNIGVVYEFDADDYVEVIVYQNSGGSLNIESPTDSSGAGANLRAARVG